MSNDVDAALASAKLFKQQLENALAIRYGNKGAKPMNTPNNDAADTIVAPFALNAGAIVEKVDKETGAAIYEVEKDGKVIYSTVTKPLAFAFLAGVNAVPREAKTAADPASAGAGSKERDKGGGKPESASVQQSQADASSDDKSGAPKPEPRKRVFL